LLHQLGATVVRRPLADLPRLAHHDTSSGLPVLSIVCRPDETGFLDSRYSPEALLEALTDRSEVGGVEEAVWARLRVELERVGLVTVEGMFLKPHSVLGEVKALEPEPAEARRHLPLQPR
jgi:hypothetical protein